MIDHHPCSEELVSAVMDLEDASETHCRDIQITMIVNESGCDHEGWNKEDREAGNDTEVSV